jgi:hypothetical protein
MNVNNGQFLMPAAAGIGVGVAGAAVVAAGATAGTAAPPGPWAGPQTNLLVGSPSDLIERAKTQLLLHQSQAAQRFHTGWTNIIMPSEETTSETWVTSTWTSRNASAEQLAEEAPAPLVSMSYTAEEGRIDNWGIGCDLHLGKFRTEEGPHLLALYFDAMWDIMANAVDRQVVAALISVRDQTGIFAESTQGHAIHENQLREYLNASTSFFCAFNDGLRNAKGILAFYRRFMSIHHNVNPDTLVVPSGSQYIIARQMDLYAHAKAGKHAEANIAGRDTFVLPMIEPGTAIIEVPAFAADAEAVGLTDNMWRNKQIGEYYHIKTDTNISPKAYTTEMNTIWIHSDECRAGSLVPITSKAALDACMRFDDNGEVVKWPGALDSAKNDMFYEAPVNDNAPAARMGLINIFAKRENNVLKDVIGFAEQPYLRYLAAVLSDMKTRPLGSLWVDNVMDGAPVVLAYNGGVRPAAGAPPAAPADAAANREFADNRVPIRNGAGRRDARDAGVGGAGLMGAPLVQAHHANAQAAYSGRLTVGDIAASLLQVRGQWSKPAVPSLAVYGWTNQTSVKRAAVDSEFIARTNVPRVLLHETFKVTELVDNMVPGGVFRSNLRAFVTALSKKANALIGLPVVIPENGVATNMQRIAAAGLQRMFGIMANAPAIGNLQQYLAGANMDPTWGLLLSTSQLVEPTLKAMNSSSKALVRALSSTSDAALRAIGAFATAMDRVQPIADTDAVVAELARLGALRPPTSPSLSAAYTAGQAASRVSAEDTATFSDALARAGLPSMGSLAAIPAPAPARVGRKRGAPSAGVRDRQVGALFRRPADGAVDGRAMPAGPDQQRAMNQRYTHVANLLDAANPNVRHTLTTQYAAIARVHQEADADAAGIFNQALRHGFYPNGPVAVGTQDGAYPSIVDTTANTYMGINLYGWNRLAMIMASRIHKDLFSKFITENLPMPVDFLVFSPFMTYRLADAVFMLRGAQTANLMYFKPDFLRGMDVHSGTMHFNLHMRFGPRIRQRKNIMVIRNVACDGVVGGIRPIFHKLAFNTFKDTDAEDNGGANGVTIDSPGLYSMMIPITPQDGLAAFTKVISITGQFNLAARSIITSRNGRRAAEGVHYATAAFYQGLHVFPATHLADSPVNTNEQSHNYQLAQSGGWYHRDVWNTFCFPAKCFRRAGTDGKLWHTTTGRGHWGRLAGAGAKLVRTGVSQDSSLIDFDPPLRV